MSALLTVLMLMAPAHRIPGPPRVTPVRSPASHNPNQPRCAADLGRYKRI